MGDDPGRRRRWTTAPPATAATLLGAVLVLALASVGAAPPRQAAGGDPFFRAWRTISRHDGLPSDKVLAVLVHRGGVWAGTEKGLARIEGGRVVDVLDTADGLPFAAVSSLAADAETGDLWIGTLGGLARLSGGRIDAFTQLDSGLANDVVYGVAVDGPTVWIATAAGLSQYDPRPQAWQIFDTSNTLMHEPWCYAVDVREGTVYVAVWGGGVVVREAESGRFRSHRDPDGEMEIDLFRDDGLVHDVTSAISVTDEAMWVGTYFGLSRYDGRRWRTYNQDDSGLAGDFINFLRARGAIVWIATDQGLSRFDSDTWHTWRRRDDRPELRITERDGTTRTMPLGSGPAGNTIYGVDLDGDDIWLATGSGLSHGVAGGGTATRRPTGNHPPHRGAPR